MNRYPYYLVSLCALTSPFLYIPRLLLQDRYHGAIAAVGIAMLLGVLLSYFFITSLKPFHELTLHEILDKHVSHSTKFLISFLLGLTWLAAGASVLITISFVIKRFMNPSMNLHVLILCFLIAGCWAALRATMPILYNLELWLFITIPILLFIWIKEMRNETFSWDAVLTMSDYALKVPSWELIAVSSFLFTGYISLSITNGNSRVINKMHWIWFIPVIGIIVFSATFFIPIGIHGTQAVDKYVYIGVNTADSIQMKFGLIERGVFLYLLCYIILSLLFIVMSWHVALKWMGGAFNNYSVNFKRILVGMVSISVFIYGYYSTEKQVMSLTYSWFTIRFIAEILLVVLMVRVKRRLGCE
ncbi:GerAB/ArcD/ProY family transporter [Paenibacillus terrigena]|uniref:GerAB/ArcD/ProY family transporter n=1 Tax=Paenibacillus terrigena TaxID=369333 RepID=UPI00039D1A3C|nr:GerAB/ArcD/ProY family transporter [Paenibacillus terrigena]